VSRKPTLTLVSVEQTVEAAEVAPEHPLDLGRRDGRQGATIGFFVHVASFPMSFTGSQEAGIVGAQAAGDRSTEPRPPSDAA
jgi:hypothetical protein